MGCCRTIVLENGETAIVCSRGERRKRCKECNRDATKQCDFPLRGSKSGKTCDVYLCNACATPVGNDRDYCPPHARIADVQTALPLGEEEPLR